MNQQSIILGLKMVVLSAEALNAFMMHLIPFVRNLGLMMRFLSTMKAVLSRVVWLLLTKQNALIVAVLLVIG
jgi:hypothetical protein